MPTATTTRRPTQPRLVRDVAPGVHRLEHAHVNCYLVEGDDGVTLVDSAFPASRRALEDALHAVGRSVEDLRAVVLTHAHFDHLGMAHGLQADLGLPVFADTREEYLAAHPYRYAHESPRLLYAARYPQTLPMFVRMIGAGALRVRGIDGVRRLDPSAPLPVPGAPTVVPSPGHTWGHCALLLPDRDVLLSGDALVTLDPYTGATGPRIISGAATADSALALASLATLAKTGARVVLPGHGEPWREGVESAAHEAMRAGPS